jgi:hypothetical protein
MADPERASSGRTEMNTVIIDRESEPGSWADALDRGCLTGRVGDHVDDGRARYSCPSPNGGDE